MKMFESFAKCRSLTTMGLGMLIGASFLHLVSAMVNDFILPFFNMKPQMMAMPHLLDASGKTIHAISVFVIVCVCSYLFLKWSDRLTQQ